MRIHATIALSTIVIFLPVTILTLKLTPQVKAFTMENGGYIIQQGDVGFEKPKTPNEKPSPTPLPGSYSGEKYQVLVEPAQEKKDQSLDFSINDLVISFGDITPGEPISRTVRIEVNSFPDAGYQIVAQENHELKNLESHNIPDTTCDSGNCSAGTAAIWDNPLTYGFGYRCNNIEGSTCQLDFNEAQNYKSMANFDKKQAPQVVSAGAVKSITESVLKLNIPQSQAKGVYQNIIKYIAVPKI